MQSRMKTHAKFGRNPRAIDRCAHEPAPGRRAIAIEPAELAVALFETIKRKAFLCGRQLGIKQFWLTYGIATGID